MLSKDFFSRKSSAERETLDRPHFIFAIFYHYYFIRWHTVVAFDSTYIRPYTGYVEVYWQYLEVSIGVPLGCSENFWKKLIVISEKLCVFSISTLGRVKKQQNNEYDENT